MIQSRTDDDTAAMNRQLDVEDRSRRPDTDIEMDRQVEEAQEAMLARHAPDTRVRSPTSASSVSLTPGTSPGSTTLSAS
jgi:hypothetical protein